MLNRRNCVLPQTGTRFSGKITTLAQRVILPFLPAPVGMFRDLSIS